MPRWSDAARHRLRAGAVALIVVLAGCSATPIVTPTPDPAAVPSGSLEAHGVEATGPVVELGTGQTLGIGWRYAIFESSEGWCTQLEAVGQVTTGCGELPSGEDAFGLVVSGGLEGGGTVVSGAVTAETATVWLVGADQARLPATLMSLEAAGPEGQAFVGIFPPGATLTHVMAVAANGEVLETYELP